MNMKYTWFALLLTLLLVACSKEEEEVLPDRTILVYMAAENSLSSYALQDVEEMLVGMESIDDSKNKLLVYLDTDTYDSDQQTKQAPAIYWIHKNKQGNVIKEMVYQYPEQDASSITVERMSDVFQRTFSAFQAQSYGLILWSHGDGWIPFLTEPSSLRSFGQDGGSNGYMMDFLDLCEAVRQGTQYLNNKSRFDFIYFDACFMQSVEVLYQLRSYADYFMGSPMETPASGTPFDKLLTQLFTQGEAGIKSFTEGYYNEYAQNYNGGKNSTNSLWTSGVYISAVRSESLDQLAEATQTIYSEQAEKMSTITESDVKDVQYFDHNRRYNRVNMRIYFDLGDYIKHLTEQESLDTWTKSLDAAIVCSNATPTCFCSSAYNYTGNGDIAINAACGLSTYILFPQNAKYASWNTYYKQLDWYKRVYGGK